MTSPVAAAGGPPPPTEPVPAGPGGSFTFAQVLWAELRHLGRHDGGAPAPPDASSVYARIGGYEPEKALSALCFSGGGIRSATFNLGVLQALAKLGLLDRFDYLSSVSGGGYIAGWLKKWLHVRPLATLSQILADPTRDPEVTPLQPEPKPIDYLREYSNYLTPRVGLFSADTWAAAALIVRNLILNWLVLVPVLAVIVAVPQLALLIAAASPMASPGQPNPTAAWGANALHTAAVLALWASAAAYHLRRDRNRPATEKAVLMLVVVPLLLACLALAFAGLWLRAEAYDDPHLWGFSLLWCAGIPLFGWLLAVVSTRGQTGSPGVISDLAGIVLSGGIVAVPLFALTRSSLPALEARPPLFIVFAVPILLGLYLLARSLFVAFASLGERRGTTPEKAVPAAPSATEIGHADREWWARLSGWILLFAVAWLGGSAIVVLGQYLLTMIAGKAVALMGGASGLAAALLGASSSTSGKSDRQDAPTSRVAEWSLRLLAPLTIVFVAIGLAEMNARGAGFLTGLPASELRVDRMSWRPTLPVGLHLADVLGGPFASLVAAVFASWLLGWVVNVNRFSAHGLYRNRLVRAYLGASNLSRQADPFTGFDPRDDLPLHELAGGASPRPLLVVNATLNLVRGQKLAWQQRKAESFSMTPLFCGNFHDGYRLSREYGGSDGISLGAAITTSGAAANPNAGYHSSPLVSFLMTLFNVRLGCWLGNTNEHGAKVFRSSGPRHAWMSLFADLLGFTDARHAYVSLSDGGHFENLGAYEMVLRRCRQIVVVDVGQDPTHSLEDLGNLVRKVRVDFGIPITFETPIAILPRAVAGSGLLCALGTIGYDEVDRGTSPGQLLYLKPTLRGPSEVPYDVFSYARSSRDFPHQTTADQWFSESQFESYRALGQYLAGRLGEGGSARDLPSLFEATKKKLEHAAGEPGFKPLAI